MLQQRVGPWRRGRQLQRQRGRSDEGDGCRRGRSGTHAVVKEIAKASSLTIFSCPCARRNEQPRSMSSELQGPLQTCYPFDASALSSSTDRPLEGCHQEPHHLPVQK